MKKPLVMVCDDDETIVKLTSIAIRSQGYEVINAGSDTTVFLYLEQYKPDLILLDLNLPHPGGIAVMREVRSSAGPIPVILFSGDDGLPETSKKVGAAGYLAKPYSIAALTEILNSILKKDQ